MPRCMQSEQVALLKWPCAKSFSYAGHQALASNSISLVVILCLCATHDVCQGRVNLLSGACHVLPIAGCNADMPMN
jgi:hypothetical protein